MAKEIVKEDLPKLEALTEGALGTRDLLSVERMGGLTNHTYKVTVASGEYVVRIPGEGTEEIIVRGDEEKSTRLACALGIDAELLYFGADGSKVTRYIDKAVTLHPDTIGDEKIIKQIAAVFKKLHTCGKDTGVPFEVFEMAESYLKIIQDKGVAMFADFDRVREAIVQIKKEIDNALDVHKVPCHNDALCENWVLGGDKLYLIDWEYAGMNDGMWDLADVSIEAGFDHQKDQALLQAYLGRRVDLIEEKHLLASKIYVDFLWTLWAKARVPYDGQPMEDWAAERYTRLKTFLAEYKNLSK